MPPTTRGQVARAATEASRATTHEVFSGGQLLSDYISHKKSFRPPSKGNAPDQPPRFVIDLSTPPEQRYLDVCAHFEEQMRGLTRLFDDVVVNLAQVIPLVWLHRICRLLLRRVYCGEENAELKGISRATNVPMYLLVCFNVLLDLFMGCSSGGAAVSSGDHDSKMVHFRTLDWGMDPLRGIVVQLDFKMEAQGPIVASAITYAGYVGVLTGVRHGFSVSLNFRPTRHRRGQFWPDLLYYWHLLLVLLGRRRSISSQLRRFLLPTNDSSTSGQFRTYRDVVEEVSGRGRWTLTTTACYLCLSDGQETTIVQRDRVTATTRSSNDFIVITNDDLEGEENEEVSPSPLEQSEFAGALAEIVSEAKDRRQCAVHNYQNMRARKVKGLRGHGEADLRRVLTVDDIVEMVQLYPTLNESSHYACVMDASAGSVHWCRRWWKPVSSQWIRAHQSDTW